MVRAVVFDLDGTLIDSALDIHAAANRVLSEKGLVELDLPTLKSFVGEGVRVLMQRCLDHANASTSPEDLQKSVARFLEVYAEAPAKHTVIYPGVEDLLAKLQSRGDRLGICTNKPEAITRTVLNDLGLASTFGVVIGGDTLPTRKPDPSGLLATIAQLGSKPDETIYVGDSEVDAATAQAAGIKFVLFTNGYRKSPVASIPHWRAHDTFAEIESSLLTDDATANG